MDPNQTTIPINDLDAEEDADWDNATEIEVENTTYPSATVVTNYEYEVALNESKRKIDLLRNDYLGMFVDEFTNMV